MRLTDLDTIVRRSGLRVVELPGWKTRGRDPEHGRFNPRGVLCHHTGASSGGRSYVDWMTFTGRGAELPPPLVQLSLGRDSTVYVCAAGRANHAGKARSSGPMPAGDGNELYVGIEAQNSGTEGWASKGTDAAGNTITQLEGYVRLCRALCDGYRWGADRVRAHKETSITGKWDPGGLDMGSFRSKIAALNLDRPAEDTDMEPSQIATAKITLTDPDGKKLETTVQGALDDTRDRVLAGNKRLRDETAAIRKKLDALTKLVEDLGKASSQ